MLNAYTPLPSGQYTFGFKPMAYDAYQSMYVQPNSLSVPAPTGSFASIGNSTILPPTSMGSVDFSVTSK